MGKTERLYLDHAATTPVLPETQAAMAEALQSWANPSSPHADGRASRAALEGSRKDLAEALGWRHDVVLTSGATEAIGIVASRVKAERRIVGSIEHDAVIAAMGEQAIVLPVGHDGLIDLPALEQALVGEPALVAIQLINNEIGVIQPIDRIQQMVTDAGSFLLADCAQGAGKMALPDADFLAISGHKFGGPPGAGALLAKDLGTIAPSGGQERGYRRGTENGPAAAGMAAALKSRAFADAMPRLVSLRQQLEHEMVVVGGVVIAADAPRIATIGAYAMPGVQSASQLVQFDIVRISVSAGSACSSGSMKPSRVVEAMGLPAEIGSSMIRVSFGPSTQEDDIERFLAEWRRIRNHAKAAAA